MVLDSDIGSYMFIQDFQRYSLCSTLSIIPIPALEAPDYFVLRRRGSERRFPENTGIE